jgi:hypothetical protein
VQSRSMGRIKYQRIFPTHVISTGKTGKMVKSPIGPCGAPRARTRAWRTAASTYSTRVYAHAPAPPHAPPRAARAHALLLALSAFGILHPNSAHPTARPCPREVPPLCTALAHPSTRPSPHEITHSRYAPAPTAHPNPISHPQKTHLAHSHYHGTTTHSLPHTLASPHWQDHGVPSGYVRARVLTPDTLPSRRHIHLDTKTTPTHNDTTEPRPPSTISHYTPVNHQAIMDHTSKTELRSQGRKSLRFVITLYSLTLTLLPNPNPNPYP